MDNQVHMMCMNSSWSCSSNSLIAWYLPPEWLSSLTEHVQILGEIQDKGKEGKHASLWSFETGGIANVLL